MESYGGYFQLLPTLRIWDLQTAAWWMSKAQGSGPGRARISPTVMVIYTLVL